jgi:hypothetical protein
MSFPKTKEPLLSDQNPFNSAETSMFIRSPSLSIFSSEGIPCAASSFTLMQE